VVRDNSFDTRIKTWIKVAIVKKMRHLSGDWPSIKKSIHRDVVGDCGHTDAGGDHEYLEF